MPWLSFAQGGLSLKSSCTGSTLHKGTTTKEHHSHCRFKDWKIFFFTRLSSGSRSPSSRPLSQAGPWKRNMQVDTTTDHRLGLHGFGLWTCPITWMCSGKFPTVRMESE